MKIENKHLDSALLWAWDWGEKAFKTVKAALIVLLVVAVLSVPIGVPVVMLFAGKSLGTCVIAGILLAFVWAVLLACFASFGLKEHTLWFANELEFFQHNDDFLPRPSRLPHASKDHGNAIVFKRKGGDLAFLFYREDRGYLRDKVHLAVIDSDYNLLHSTTYPADSKSPTELESLYNEIMNRH